MPPEPPVTISMEKSVLKDKLESSSIAFQSLDSSIGLAIIEN